MSNINKFAKTSGVYFVGNFLTQVITFFLLPIYTKYIPPQDLGYFDLSVSYLNIIIPVVCFEIWAAIMRFMFDFVDKNEKYKAIFNGLIIFSISLCIYSAVALSVNTFINVQYVLLIFLYGLFTMFMNIYSFIARGFGLNFAFAVSGVFGSIIYLVSNIVLIVIFKMGFKSLYISAIIGLLIQILFLEYKANVLKNLSIKLFDFSIIKQIVKFAFPLSLNSICFWFLMSYNRVFISNHFGLYENGLFAIASRFAVALTLIASCFSLAWQELAFSKGSNSGENKSLFYSKASDYYLRFLFMGVVALIPIIKLIFSFLIDSAYSKAISIIPLFLLAIAASHYSNFYGNIFGAEKKTNVILYSTLTAALVNVSVLYFSVGFFGLQVANISLLSGFIVNIIIRVLILRKKIAIKIDIKFISFGAILFVFVCYFYFKDDVILNFTILILMLIISAFVFKDLIKKIIFIILIKKRKNV